MGDVNSSQDLCGETQCDHGGVCYPRRQGSGPPTASTTCVCPPPYTGPRCSGTKTRCDEIPCRNGGNCTDQEDGFICDCDNTGYSGTYCHIEDNSCAGLTCENGATCLGEWFSFSPALSCSVFIIQSRCSIISLLMMFLSNFYCLKLSHDTTLS